MEIPTYDPQLYELYGQIAQSSNNDLVLGLIIGSVTLLVLAAVAVTFLLTNGKIKQKFAKDSQDNTSTIITSHHDKTHDIVTKTQDKSHDIITKQLDKQAEAIERQKSHDLEKERESREWQKHLLEVISKATATIAESVTKMDMNNEILRELIQRLFARVDAQSTVTTDIVAQLARLEIKVDLLLDDKPSSRKVKKPNNGEVEPINKSAISQN